MVWYIIEMVPNTDFKRNKEVHSFKVSANQSSCVTDRSLLDKLNTEKKSYISNSDNTKTSQIFKCILNDENDKINTDNNNDPILNLKTDIVNKYDELNLVPFSTDIKWNTETRKKIYDLTPFTHITRNNFRNSIDHNKNGMALRMGIEIQTGFYLIGIDIDIKDNGITKWTELIRSYGDINTPI